MQMNQRQKEHAEWCLFENQMAELKTIFALADELGPVPKEVPSMARPRYWGGFLLDWGVCGPRGNPDDTAYLRGMKGKTGWFPPGCLP